MSRIQIPTKSFQPHKWQLEVLQAFDAGKFKFGLLNWHRRARKTTLGLNLLIRECCKNENSVYGYIAPTYKQAKSIVWIDPNMLPKYLPKEVIKQKNESELRVEFTNGSLLVVRGADNPDTLRGQDYAGVFIDEFAQVKPEIWEEILRPIITQNPERWALFAFTPKGINHAYEYWHKSEGWDNWYRSLLRASESDIMTPEALTTAREEMPDVLFRQEFECEFSAGDEFTLITPDDIEKIKGMVRIKPFPKRFMAVDPAAGGDEAVIMSFSDTEIDKILTSRQKDTMKLAGQIMIEYRRIGAEEVAIDTIGLGKPIADRLKELGAKVRYINSSSKPSDDNFYNLRAEMYWTAAAMVQDAECAYPEEYELRRQLTSIKYDVSDSSGKIKIEPKQKVKERISRSPDWADTWVMGQWVYKTYGKSIMGKKAIPRQHRRQKTSYDPYGR